LSYNIIIPARYASERLPGKPLLDIEGKPMIQRVFEQVSQTQATSIYIATDDQRISDVAHQFTENVCMTSSEHPSGTDRLYEAAQQLNLDDDEIIINVQGDEPLMPTAVVEQLAANLQNRSDILMATLCEPITSAKEYNDPNSVKVVRNKDNLALYFSRSTIPHWRDNTSDTQHPVAYRHLGIYAYRVKFLKLYSSWAHCELEQYEKLEQLRALHEGVDIHVDLACESIPPGVDTPEDLTLIQNHFKRMQK
jgi:3-deoxy-manno-octulosonate cytidylyltransferase (CMP-KDO synthetase)